MIKEYLNTLIIMSTPLGGGYIIFAFSAVRCPLSPLLAAILNFCEKQKNLNISETVRDRAIWTEFLTRRVVGKYSIQN